MQLALRIHQKHIYLQRNALVYSMLCSVIIISGLDNEELYEIVIISILFYFLYSPIYSVLKSEITSGVDELQCQTID